MYPSTASHQLAILKATATADDGNVPGNVLDNNLNTRWSAQGRGQKLFLDLDKDYAIDGVDIMYYKAAERTSTCDIIVGATNAATDMTSEPSKPVTRITFNPRNGKQVTLVCDGNSVNDWNSIIDVKIFGTEIAVPGPAPGPVPPSPTPVPPSPTPVPPPPATTGLDQFGVKMINPTVSGGRTFFLPTNLPATRVKAVARMGSSECVSQGDGGETPGTSYWKMDGTWPRCYVYDAQRAKKWADVEATCYFMKVSPSTNSISGIVMAARSIHESGGSNAKTYGIKHQYSNNTLSFYKEQVHPTYKFVRVGTWPIPSNTWLGYKLTIRNKTNGHVVLRVYMDITDGKNGGDWKLLGTYTDTGTLDGNPPIKDGTSGFVRTDSVTDFRYKKWSMRAIAPEP